MSAPSLVVLGASGFVGAALVRAAAEHLPVKAVARRVQGRAQDSRARWFACDIATRGALADVIEQGDIVVNLAYLRDAAADENTALIHNVVDGCMSAGASRLIHVSTAIVAGAAHDPRVTEETVSMPTTEYERTKLTVEARLLGEATGRLDTGIVRPTAVVGPGGENLVTLARSLLAGSSLTNYLRASLFGTRSMHLVPVHTVVDAILHLAARAAPLGGGVFIVAADDDQGNAFDRVERELRVALGVPARTVPVIKLPRVVLAMLLKLRGRAAGDLSRHYDDARLRSTGFHPRVSVAEGVREFGEAFRAQASVRAGRE